MERRNQQKRTLVGISELVETYLPMSEKICEFILESDLDWKSNVR